MIADRLLPLLRILRSGERSYSPVAYLFGAVLPGRRLGAGPVAWLRGWPMPDLRPGAGRIELGHVGLYPGVRLHCRGEGRIAVGDGTFINRRSRVLAGCAVQVGRDCMISWDCAITDWSGFASPAAFAPVILEDNVWVGCRVTILGGTRLGRGCIVAAGSVVQGEFAPGSVVAGPSAKGVP